MHKAGGAPQDVRTNLFEEEADDDDLDYQASKFQKQSGKWWGKYTDYQTLVISLLIFIIILLLILIALVAGMYLGFYYGEPELEKRIKKEVIDEIGDLATLYIESGECVWEAACPAIFAGLVGPVAAEAECSGLNTSNLLADCGLLSTSLLSSLSSTSPWSSPTPSSSPSS